jgi:hypothetical protein
MTTKAATVSATLRRSGLNPASPSDYNRQGLKAKQSGNRVRVVADIDDDAVAAQLATEAADVLAGAGYAVEVASNDAFYVTKA